MEDMKNHHSCSDPLEWTGLYGSEAKYKKYLSAETFAHPAKMSLLLCEGIYKHLERLGLLKKGDTVIDFMAGTARTGVLAELHGYKFCGIELETHFIEMIRKNKETMKGQTNREPNWEILQGDARHLSTLLKKAGVGIVSPPYANRLADDDKREWMDAEHKHRRPNTSYTGIVSPPYSSIEIGKGLNTLPPRPGRKDQSGRNPNAPSQVATRYTGIVSPPYADSINSEKNGIDVTKIRGKDKHIGKNSDLTKRLSYIGITSPPYGEAISKQGGPVGLKNVGISTKTAREYGRSNGQIGNFPDKMVGIMSPPYVDALVGKNGPGIDKRKQWTTYRKSGGGLRFEAFVLQQEKHSVEYSSDPSNISNLSDKNSPDAEQTYTGAMLQVYKEAFKSGISPLVTVTKNPTKKGKLRRLDLDTAKLLEMAGYVIIDYHRAILFERKTQKTLVGSSKEEYKGRLSFFKRLSAQKGNVVAEWEDVIIAAIPGGKNDKMTSFI